MKNIFHIGYHKTATTWFQKRFYPYIHHFDVVDRKKIRDHFYQKKEQKFNNNSLIFCDEELSGNIHNSGLSGFLTDAVANKISNFSNPKVIIFIRNQHDIIVSSYLQYIKEGGNYSLNQYLNHKMYKRNNRTSLFSYEHFNYFELISKYVSLIGKENVYVYLYEDFCADQKGFISQFVLDHKFNINIDSLDFSRTNYTYSYISLIFARFFNSFTRKNVLYKYYIFHVPYLYEIFRDLFTRIQIFKIDYKSFLGNKRSKEIHQQYSESNSKLAKEYNLDLKKYNYPL